MKTILIIEDDTTIVMGLEAALEFHGYRIVAAANGMEGLAQLERARTDLVILDLMLPDIDGYEVCRKIREHDRQIPIIMLTAKSQESDKLLGFQLGADDYVTKPFSAMELLARIKAILKRSGNQPEPEKKISIGEANIELDNFLIRRGDEEFRLSPKEHDILSYLIQHPNIVISRQQLIDGIWGEEYDPSPKTIDNFIRKLRVKLEADAAHPRHLLTVHGAGYKLKV